MPLFSVIEDAVIKNINIQLEIDGAFEAIRTQHREVCINEDGCSSLGYNEIVARSDDWMIDYGLLAMKSENSLIENVALSGFLYVTLDKNDINDIDGSYAHVGALVGMNNGTIKNVQQSLDFQVNMVNTDSSIGGKFSVYNVGSIAGLNEGSIQEVVADNQFIFNGRPNDILSYVGGIVGMNEGEVSFVDASLRVENYTGIIRLLNAYGIGYTGGIAGENSSKGSINDTVFTGYLNSEVGSTSKMGGVVGHNEGEIENLMTEYQNIPL